MGRRRGADPRRRRRLRQRRSDDAAATTTTAAASGDSAKTVAFDKTIQQQLKDVGCYDGDVDGIMGPETDRAIIDFQTADGLTVDGELGPETDTALRDAAQSGKTVCSGGSSGTTTPPVTITPATAPCTATAIAAALPSGDKITVYVCSEGWAAGSATNGQDDSNFVLQGRGRQVGRAGPVALRHGQRRSPRRDPEVLRRLLIHTS